MVLKKIFQLLKRRKIARKFGIQFERCATFQLPENILLNGKQHRLFLPNENGVKVAFLDLILDDCYRCNKIADHKDIKTILDIGANVGLFGLIARAVFPNAVIHAYEPNPDLEKYLSNQAEIASITYFMEAIGADNGYVSLDVNVDSVLTRSQVNTNGNIPKTAFRTAIDRLGGNVDFLKMDCEGAEWDIFEDKDSWQNIHHLSMEYHLFHGQSINELQEIVQTLGFKISSIIPCGDDFGLLTASRTGV